MMKNKKVAALAAIVIFCFSALSSVLYILLTRLFYENLAADYIFWGTWLLALAAASVVRLISGKFLGDAVKLKPIYVDLAITLITLGAFWLWG